MSKLDTNELGFLVRVRDGLPLPLADRKGDRVRQRMRRAGYVHVVPNPRRWELLPAGRRALEEQSDG